MDRNHCFPGDGSPSDPATTTRDGDDAERPSRSVIEAVADATERDPTDLDPLYETIDPDALDAIFESTADRYRPSSKTCVSFRFEGCEVAVHADGRTIVSRL
jgi:hypothetical protein